MNKSLTTNRDSQKGAAVLLTAVILIIAASIILFVSARIALNQSKTSANDYRTAQAVEAALAGIDQGVLVFNETGQVIDTSLFASPADIANLTDTCPSTPGTGVGHTTGADTLGIYYFSNSDATTPPDRCESGGASDAGTLFAVGWSDDCSAIRQMSVCLGTIPILNEGEGPKQPFVTRAGVGAIGSAQIVNRFTNISIWAGSTGEVQGNAFNTYLRPSGTSTTDYTWSQLISDVQSDNTQVVSNQLSGFGIDVVTGDPSLDAATPDEFWGTFMANSKSTTKGLAEIYTSADDIPENSGGVIWLDTDASTSNVDLPDTDAAPPYDFSISGGTYGSFGADLNAIDDDETAILVINGNVKITGGTFYGMVYVTGKLEIVGNPKIFGTLISENGPTTGSGTANIIYVPMGGDGGEPPTSANAGVRIPGSWRDWQ